LPKLKIAQTVKVSIDKDKDAYTVYDGKIAAIASKAEFTPKTIQTKDERANLVYAVKILVKNDGLIKIGMYGEVKF
jgi:HlyD family secretion protein